MSDINVTVQDEIVNIDVLDTPVLVNVVNSPGQQGPAGPGVPVGGTAGQVLAKNSSTNYDTAWVNPSGGGVPYSGATGNVNIGEYELKAGQLTLDLTPTGTAAVGTTRWNDTIGATETTLKGGSVVLKNGIDLVARVVNKVTPNTTLTKAAYQAVRVSGAQGQRLAVALAQANNDTNSADTIGLVTETIPTNQEGFIMTMGQLENINTTGSLQGETWVDGDVLYLSPTVAGAITNVKPTGAGHIVVIGYVEYAHANNGKIYVKVLNGWELEELHDVDIVSPANNEALIYESSTALWKNKTIATALGFTPVPTSRTITINGVTFDLSADRSYTVAAGISGSGASGQVTYWTGASAVSGSNNLTWDNSIDSFTLKTENISNPNRGFQIQQYGNSIPGANSTFRKARGTILSPTNVLANDLVGAFQYSSYVGGAFTSDRSLFGANMATSTGIGLFFIAGSTNGNYVPSLYIHPTGNVVVNGGGSVITGGITDGGQKFQVYGDTILRGSGNTSATTALTVQNSDSTNMWRFLNNGDLLVGTTSEVTLRPNNGTITSPQLSGRGLTINIAHISGTGSGVIINNVNGDRTATSGVSNTLLVQNGFAPTSGTGQFNMIVAQGTINQTGGANGITRGLYVNPTLTAAADFRAIEVSAGITVLAPSVTARASLRIPSGTAPTTPNDGDIWFNGTNIQMRIGGVTKTFTLI